MAFLPAGAARGAIQRRYSSMEKDPMARWVSKAFHPRHGSLGQTLALTSSGKPGKD